MSTTCPQCSDCDFIRIGPTVSRCASCRWPARVDSQELNDK